MIKVEENMGKGMTHRVEHTQRPLLVQTCSCISIVALIQSLSQVE